jgi:hypothetical protein
MQLGQSLHQREANPHSSLVARLALREQVEHAP